MNIKPARGRVVLRLPREERKEEKTITPQMHLVLDL